jgi:nucleolar protein 56
MKYLITLWFGTFLLNSKKKIASSNLFPKEKNEIARRLNKICRGEILEEERAIAKGLSPKVNEVRLSSIGKYEPSKFFREFAISPEEFGFSNELLKVALEELAILKIKQTLEQKEVRVLQAVAAMDDLTKTINLLIERLRKWYFYYSPEISKEVNNNEEFVELVNKLTQPSKIIEKIGLPPAKCIYLPMDKGNEALIKSFSACLIRLINSKREVKKFIEESTLKIAPNLSDLIGPSLAAHLVAKVGSLKKLSLLPSSTIQLLGAEKALFSHLREGKRPPKHGLIFQSPLVNKAPPRERGKIARALAGKLAIAAKADTFTHNYIASSLKAELNKTLKRIKRENKQP